MNGALNGKGHCFSLEWNKGYYNDQVYYYQCQIKGKSLEWSLQRTDFLSVKLTFKIGIIHVGDSTTHPVTKSHPKRI